MERAIESGQANVRQVFNAMDKNGDGVLSRTEFKIGLEKMNLIENISQGELDELMAFVDCDGKLKEKTDTHPISWPPHPSARVTVVAIEHAPAVIITVADLLHAVCCWHCLAVECIHVCQAMTKSTSRSSSLCVEVRAYSLRMLHASSRHRARSEVTRSRVR
jgi:hypothetical protein